MYNIWTKNMNESESGMGYTVPNLQSHYNKTWNCISYKQKQDRLYKLRPQRSEFYVFIIFPTLHTDFAILWTAKKTTLIWRFIFMLLST